MPDWMRRWLNTDTTLVSEERKQNRQLQKMLMESLKESQELNRKFVQALDRVIVSRFDLPVMPKPMQQPITVAFPDLSDQLSIEDDREFLENSNA